MKNSGQGISRKTAEDDERWIKLARIAHPESEINQRRFIKAVVALQTNQPDPDEKADASIATCDAEGVHVKLHPDFTGTVDVKWGDMTFRISRIS